MVKIENIRARTQSLFQTKRRSEICTTIILLCYFLKVIRINNNPNNRKVNAEEECKDNKLH